MKTFEVTCVSHDWSVGTMQIEAITSEDAIEEMKTYPAVKYVIACEEMKSVTTEEKN